MLRNCKILNEIKIIISIENFSRLFIRYQNEFLITQLLIKIYIFCWRVLSFILIILRPLVCRYVKLHMHKCIYRDKWISGLLFMIKVWFFLLEISLIYRHLFNKSYIRWSINKATKDLMYISLWWSMNICSIVYNSLFPFAHHELLFPCLSISIFKISVRFYSLGWIKIGHLSYSGQG